MANVLTALLGLDQPELERDEKGNLSVKKPSWLTNLVTKGAAGDNASRLNNQLLLNNLENQQALARLEKANDYTISAEDRAKLREEEINERERKEDIAAEQRKAKAARKALNDQLRIQDKAKRKAERKDQRKSDIEAGRARITSRGGDLSQYDNKGLRAVGQMLRDRLKGDRDLLAEEMAGIELMAILSEPGSAAAVRSAIANLGTGDRKGQAEQAAIRSANSPAARNAENYVPFNGNLLRLLESGDPASAGHIMATQSVLDPTTGDTTEIIPNGVSQQLMQLLLDPQQEDEGLSNLRQIFRKKLLDPTFRKLNALE